MHSIVLMNNLNKTESVVLISKVLSISEGFVFTDYLFIFGVNLKQWQMTNNEMNIFALSALHR